MSLGAGPPSGEAAAADTDRPARLGAAREWLAVGRRKWVALGLAVVLAAAGGVGIGQLLLTALFDDEPKRKPPAWVRFHDRQVGFSLAHPAGWERIDSPDPEVPLLAAEPRRAGSLAVRKVTLPFKVTPTTLGVAQQVVERQVARNKDVRVLEPRPGKPPDEIKLDGLPGYSYVYLFRDATTGKRGAHWHVFLFEDRTTISLVFQALPKDEFKRLQPVFARVISSFRDEAP